MCTMIRIEPGRLVIVIEDNEPADRRQWLIEAIASGLRHYALNPYKRKQDGEHAAVLSELIEALAVCDASQQQ
jgi:hypothetical protein